MHCAVLQIALTLPSATYRQQQGTQQRVGCEIPSRADQSHAVLPATASAPTFTLTAEPRPLLSKGEPGAFQGGFCLGVGAVQEGCT